MVVDNAQLYKLRQGLEEEWLGGQTSNLHDCTVFEKGGCLKFEPTTENGRSIFFHLNMVDTQHISLAHFTVPFI